MDVVYVQGLHRRGSDIRTIQISGIIHQYSGHCGRYPDLLHRVRDDLFDWNLRHQIQSLMLL